MSFLLLLSLYRKKILGRSNLSAGCILKCQKIKFGVSKESALKYWTTFVSNATITSDHAFSGTLYAGYIAEVRKWCLSSWIWTNAATVRMFCSTNKLTEAILLADNLAEYQLACGGWIVRNDYDKQGAVPMVAPNDSAYIANNAFVELYISTKEQKYLDI